MEQNGDSQPNTNGTFTSHGNTEKKKTSYEVVSSDYTILR